MERIILIHWNKSTGPEPIIQYPPDKSFPGKDLFVKIWSRHELNKENSMIEYLPETIGDPVNRYVSIIQKFEGEIYFLILVFKFLKETKKSDDITNKPDILATISKNLIELIHTNKITRGLFEAFNTIKNYSRLDIEENLLDFFQNRIKNIILKILRKGVISKSELNSILNQEYGFSTINIDLIILSFFQENLVIKLDVPGIGESYFLTRDLTCIRIPPKKIQNLIMTNSIPLDEDILELYKKRSYEFFLNYDILSEIENKSLINFFLDADIRSLIKTLRTKKLSVNECLNLLNNREELFNEMLENNFIFESKGFVYLFSDIRFIKFTPYYVIEKLSKAYRSQDISFEQYKTHLKLVLAEQQDPNTTLIEYEVI